MEKTDGRPKTYETREIPSAGDSGGGVTAKLKGRHYIVGIVSYGTACDKLLNGRLPKAQVMTDLRYYTADIDTVIGLQAEDRERRWRRDLTKQKKP
ncbi:hypothetical protein OESDEN_04722 [Oesophagostomum dentatum]|uniref:Peptidase S1 domain-containing protein n=1 Tax=Oesophagostomum dentatum TaxID=61180 RepID=A0A0B1THN3_OESDE|nr:hypothetical protein OESDEN_04722 [Oesophagostomum dentatum]